MTSAHGADSAQQLGLFDAPDMPVPDEPLPASADKAATAAKKRTQNQWALLGRGFNPLGRILHLDAAPRDDRNAAGRRCGNCRFRTTDGTGGTAGTYPKCTFGSTPGKVGPRMTRGPATDCRAWWPACADHVFADGADGTGRPDLS